MLWTEKYRPAKLNHNRTRTLCNGCNMGYGKEYA